MAENIPSNFINADTLEIHYLFVDNTHTMDAFIENKCEHEILAIIKEIGYLLSVEITVETEPLGEGGLRRWLKIALKEENKKGTITTTIIAALLTVILVTPLSRVIEKSIDRIFEDTELNNLQKEKLRLEIEELKQKSSYNLNTIDYSTIIKKRKSNYYEELAKYPKIEKVTYSISDNNKKEKLIEKTVRKDDFNSFVLTTDELEPLEKEGAIIEIIAPVLKKGKYRWIGFYDGEVVPFNMKSEEFKTLVQNGNIEFKNGSSIICHLIIRRKINSEGLETNCGYDVVRVDSYFENDHPIETKEGKHHRQVKEAHKNQLKLFTDSRSIDKH